MAKTERSEYQRQLMNDRRADDRDIEIGDCTNPGRREATRLDLTLFCRTYLAGQFKREFAPAHLSDLADLQTLILEGGQDVKAAPRGDGKTTRATAAALWAFCHGHRRYFVIAAATGKKGKDLAGKMLMQLETNPLLGADFKEVCSPIRALDRKSLRAGGQTWHKQPTHIVYHPGEGIFSTAHLPDFPKYPCPLRYLECCGLTAAVRGLLRELPDGTSIRPDFILLDDPQTKESAKSDTQCQEREDLITEDLLGLAGPGETMSLAARVTVIRENDLSWRLLDRERHPAWGGRKVPMVYGWPTAWDVRWQEYAAIYLETVREKTKQTPANEYYTLHRAEMDHGASVSWEARTGKHDVSALQHAMNLRIRLGERAFFSEYQNDPRAAEPTLYTIEPEVIARALNKLPRRVMPESAQMLVAAVDINPSYALTWAALWGKKDMTAGVCDYGRMTGPDGGAIWKVDQTRGVTQAQAIFKALTDLLTALGGLTFARGTGTFRPGIVAIDAGYEMETVVQFVETYKGPLQLVADRGVGSKYFKITGKALRSGDNWFDGEIAGAHMVRRHNADFWRMKMQQAFLMPAGGPGGCTVYGDNPRAHAEFARQIAGERLTQLLHGPICDEYRWVSSPGDLHDYGDALTMCCVALASLGGSLAGVIRPVEARRIETRRCAVPLEE